MIDQKLLTFLKLCETMNYHETARVLNMTQPAVTQHIKALESEYGCRLFAYDRRRLSATRQAEALEAYARSAVFNENRLRGVLTNAPLRRLRVGATKSIGEYMIGQIVARFLSDQGRTADITVDNTEHLLRMLDENLIDFALVEGSFNKTKYGYQLFRNEAMTGICAAEHAFAGKTVGLEELFSETLILREPGSGTRDIFRSILAAHGYSDGNFARTVMASEFALICDLVRRGVGVSFVYASVAECNREVERFAIREINPVHELNFVYLKNTVASELIADFLTG